MTKHCCTTVLLLVLVTQTISAQASNGLAALSIPEGQVVSCERPPIKGVPQSPGAVGLWRIKIGTPEPIGGNPNMPIAVPRELDIMLDSNNTILAMFDRASRRGGGDVVTVFTRPNSKAKGSWIRNVVDTNKARAQFAQGDYTRRPDDMSQTTRDLTPAELAKADTLGQWLLKRSCKP